MPKATPVAPAAKLDSLRIPPIRKKRGGDQTHNIRARNSSVRISQSRGDDEDETGAANLGEGATMLTKGYSWNVANPRLSPIRHLGHILKSSKTWMLLGVFLVLSLLWTSMGSAAGEMQRYVGCGFATWPIIPELPSLRKPKPVDWKVGSTAGDLRNRRCG